MKKNSGNIAAIISLVTLGVFLVLSGCSAANNEGFALYLTRNDIPPAQMPALSHVEIAEHPFISLKDIVSYNTQTHELKLTADAYKAITKVDVPVRGKSFMVCVDRKPIYTGALWTPISSMSFDGVTIWKPLTSEEPYVVTLELGYPTSSFYGGEDPRSSPVVLKSLRQAGKLIDKLSITSVQMLPLSMKGYELYSWLEGSQWHFTLITGTNRNKTVEEITSNENFISEAGWVKIHVVGVDAMESVLSKLPQNDSISWLGSPRSEQALSGDINFTLPPEAVVNTIKEYALCNIDFAGYW